MQKESLTSKKRKLAQINTVSNTSTGKIMGDIQREAERQGYETISFVGRRKPFKDINCVKFGNGVSFWIHVVINTIFDKQGHGSYWPTKRLIERLRQENPDIIHLHNLHGYYLNIPLLFHYLSEEFEGTVFWTLHDCWPITGHCAYFTMSKCEKWKQACCHCPNKKKYPISLFLDASASNFEEKKRLFGGIKNLTVLVPSRWMKELVKDSFLKDKKVIITPNGIDLAIFRYTNNSDILKKYQISPDKKILLGVANIWDTRKGLDDFLQLAQKIDDDHQIVLVGLNRRQIRTMPQNIIGITRTESQTELAALYSAAEIFINPSREESFSLVTVEAFACGTPVIVLGSSAVGELVTEQNGIVLESNGVQDYLHAIEEIEGKGFSRDKVAKCAEKYDRNKTAADIVNLY